MQVEYINPFIIGAVDIFEQVANIEMKKSSITLKNSTKPANEIAIVIGVSGFLQGQTIYSFKEHTAERIVSSMMPNSSPEKQKEYFESALASLANMITGRATILLAGKEHVIWITPPEVVVGLSRPDVKYIQGQTLSALFTSRFGSMEINILLKAG